MRSLDALLVAALLLTGLVLGAGLAHVYAMPNKIGLTHDQYLITQQVYRGWALIGVPLYLDMAIILVAVWLQRAAGLRVGWTLGAFGWLIAGQAIFWIWTFPANAATNQWTILPVQWEALRREWEISHIAGAFCSFAALFCLALAAVRRRCA